MEIIISRELLALLTHNEVRFLLGLPLIPDHVEDQQDTVVTRK